MHCRHGLSRFAALSIAGVLFAGFFALSASPASAQGMVKQRALVDMARITVERFSADPDMSWFVDNAHKAKGLLIIPELLKAGFIWGGSGGSGVFLVRDEETGEWSQPAFYAMGSVSWGLQIGAQKSEVIMMIMSRKGLDALYAPSVKLGAGGSVALGPVGGGAEGATAPNLSADYLSFARAKGAFAGLALDGSVISVSDNSNWAYYGKDVKPLDIIIKKQVSNPHSAELRQALAKLCEKK